MCSWLTVKDVNEVAVGDFTENKIDPFNIQWIEDFDL